MCYLPRSETVRLIFLSDLVDAAENEIVVWPDDIEETASEAMMCDPALRNVESEEQVLAPPSDIESGPPSDTETHNPSRNTLEALAHPELIYGTSPYTVSLRQRVQPVPLLPSSDPEPAPLLQSSDSTSLHLANGDNGKAQDRRNLVSAQTLARNGSGGSPGGVMAHNDGDSDDDMADDQQMS